MIVLLPLVDGARGWLATHLAVFGRVPFFYYALHIPLIHVLALVVSTRADGPGIAAVVGTFAYLVQATGILFEFNSIWRQMERAITEAAQFTELLLDGPTVLDPDRPEPRPTGSADVALERVRFTHPGQGTPLFDGLDLHIGDAERVGLVGRSGGGKTTIIRLLLRLMDVDVGRILIGGRDVTRLTQVDLRSLVAYVPQDPVMFHRNRGEHRVRPARGNRCADPDGGAAAPSWSSVRICRRLPTRSSASAAKLRRQRQRVAIARAVLRDAPVLLLDAAWARRLGERGAHPGPLR
jgi:ATP-binding cassette subfamily B protein